MEQDERPDLDPSEGNTEQRDTVLASATVAVLASATVAVLAGAEDHEGVSEVVTFVRGAGSEGTMKQDDEEHPPESYEVANEDREAFENPAATATHFEFRSAAADTTPPSASLRARSWGGKQSGPSPMSFIAAGGYEQDVSECPVLGASSSSAPATCAHEDVDPATADGDQGRAPQDDKQLKRACSAPGATVAIAHASPPDSYRLMPWRSRKQYSPKRFLAAAPPVLAAAIPGSALPTASPSGAGLRAASSGVFDASASSSSSRPPSRGRRQRRPEHYIPEEAEAAASAKARRSAIVLDRFLSSHVHGSRASDSEWTRNVAAEDAAVGDQRQHGGTEGFRIRDATRHAARALSRLGCSSPPSPSSDAPGEPDGRGRFYGVLAVLGASLALTVVSCVLFYIVGKSSEPGLSGEKPDE